MRFRRLFPYLLALTMSLPAGANAGPDTLEDVAMGIRERFPRLEISPFSCADTTCSKTLSFVWFKTTVVVTMGADGRPAAITVVMPERPTRDIDLQALFDAALKGCAEAIISVAAPEMARDQRTDFATRALGDNAEDLRVGGWSFANGTTSLGFSVFVAKRE